MAAVEHAKHVSFVIDYCVGGIINLTPVVLWGHNLPQRCVIMSADDFACV